MKSEGDQNVGENKLIDENNDKDYVNNDLGIHLDHNRNQKKKEDFTHEQNILKTNEFSFHSIHGNENNNNNNDGDNVVDDDDDDDDDEFEKQSKFYINSTSHVSKGTVEDNSIDKNETNCWEDPFRTQNQNVSKISNNLEQIKWQIPSESDLYIQSLEKKLKKARLLTNERIVKNLMSGSASFDSLSYPNLTDKEKNIQQPAYSFDENNEEDNGESIAPLIQNDNLSQRDNRSSIDYKSSQYLAESSTSISSKTETIANTDDTLLEISSHNAEYDHPSLDENGNMNLEKGICKRKFYGNLLLIDNNGRNANIHEFHNIVHEESTNEAENSETIITYPDADQENEVTGLMSLTCCRWIVCCYKFFKGGYASV